MKIFILLSFAILANGFAQVSNQTGSGSNSTGLTAPFYIPSTDYSENTPPYCHNVRPTEPSVCPCSACPWLYASPNAASFGAGGGAGLRPIGGAEQAGRYPSPGNSSREGVSNAAANNIPLNAANGNYVHGTRDVEHFGAVGFLGLTFGRMASSRYTSEVATPMGSGGSWRHNWMWQVRRELDANNKETVIIQYPDGAIGYYTKPNATSLYLNELGADRSERIEVDSANNRLYRLFFEDGTSLVINRYGSYVSGTEFMLVTQVVDRYGLAYQLTYDTQRQLVRVTDPAGRFLQLTYSNVGIQEGEVLSHTFSISDAELQSSANYSNWSYPPQSVGVMGDFNAWDYNATPLIYDEDTETWSVTVPLQAGSVGYAFCVNGDTWIGVPYNGGWDSSTNVEIAPSGTASPGVAQEITFEIADSATTMQLAGSFNSWQGQSMVWNAADQVWRLTLTLSPGEYTYKFVKNGTIWLLDTLNPFQMPNGQGGQNSVIVVGNVVKKLTRVQAFSPNSSIVVGQVDYGYEVFLSGPVVYAALTSATYPDYTQATFTYSQPQFWAGRPRLATAVDPRHADKMLDRVGFTYRDDFTSGSPLEGFIKNVYSLDTNELLADLDHNDAGDELQITYVNGKQEHIKLNEFDFPVFRHRNATGSPVDATERFANGAGMIHRTIDPTGRVTEYERTAEFGRVSEIHHQDGRTIHYTFTDPAKPFYLLEETLTYEGPNGPVTLTTSYQRDAQKRITQINHPDGTYETFAYNALGQVTVHRSKNGVIQRDTYHPTLKFLTNSRLGSTSSEVGYTVYSRNSRALINTVSLPTNISGLGLTLQFTYDDAGRVISKKSNQGGTMLANETFVYDARGILQSKVDGRGKTWSYQNDFFGRMLTETDPTGKVTSYQYFGGGGGNSCGCGGGSGGPIAIVTPENTTTSFQYDVDGHKTQTTRASGSAIALTSYQEYDVLGRVIASTNEYGVVTTYVYDPYSGSLLSENIGAPFNYTTSYEYDGLGNMVKTTHADGTYVEQDYDIYGRKLQSRVYEANGTLVSKQTLTYNTLGLIATSKDGNNHITSVGYDEFARKVSMTRPDGRVQTTTYDNADNVASVVSYIGSVTGYAYDIFGRVSYSTHDGLSTTYLYENKPGGLLLSEQVKGSADSYSSYYPCSVVTYTYDNAGRQLTMVKNGITTTRQYFTPDARSITTTVGTRSTVATQDLLGRPLQTKDGLQRTTNYTYAIDLNAHTLTTTVTNPANQADVTIQDGLGRTISTKNANQETTTYEYDGRGRNLSYTNAENATFSFTYNALGQRTKRTEPDTTYQTYTYDLAGNMLQHRKADGSIATFTYTNINLPDYKSWNGSTEYTNWTYDSLGRLTQIENQDSLVTYTYVSNYGAQINTRIASEHASLKGQPGSPYSLINRSYDGYNRLSGLMSYVGTSGSPLLVNQISYNYFASGTGPLGMLQSINNDGPPPLATYSYDSSGLVQTIALENNLTTTWTRDAAYQTTSFQTKTSANVVRSGVTHGYDNAGRRKYVQYEDNLGQAYFYDAAGQVTHAKVNISNPATANATSSPTHFYDYDTVGNRDSVLAFGVTTNYVSDTVNAYSAVSGFAAPIHDANGNMTSGPIDALTTQLVYDKENRLRSSTRNGVTSTFTYDPLGRLLTVDQPAANGGSNREFLSWAGWTLMSRSRYTNGSAIDTFRYTWGLDLSQSLEGAGGVGGLLAIERNLAGSSIWDIRYTHADANGNIMALTTNSGAVSARYRYDAFGQVLSATDVDASGWVNHNIHGFSSKPHFGNQGLLYYGYRWYSPSLGRWINRDPIEERGGLNLYGFVGNDGVGIWDVLGLDPQGPTLDKNNRWHRESGSPEGGRYIPKPSNNVTPSNSIDAGRGIDGGKANGPIERGSGLPSGAGDAVASAVESIVANLSDMVDDLAKQEGKLQCDSLATKYPNCKGCSSCEVLFTSRVLPHGQVLPRLFREARFFNCRSCGHADDKSSAWSYHSAGLGLPRDLTKINDGVPNFVPPLWGSKAESGQFFVDSTCTNY